MLAAFPKMEDDTQYVKNMYRFRSLFSSQHIHVENMGNISYFLGFLTVILHTSVGTVLSSSQQRYQGYRQRSILSSIQQEDQIFKL